jgi:outer membrane protein assembly factor BamA
MAARSPGRSLCCVALGILIAARASADQLAPDELAKKNEGGYPTALPLFAYTTDLGLALGARGYYYWDGDRSDPRFATTPYLYRVFLQVFASTAGSQFHWLDFDAPKVFGSPYRLRSQLIYQRTTNQNYFGLGNASLRPLSFPGSAQFSSYADYTAAQRQIGADGTTYSRYDQYDLLRPIFIASLERLFLDERLRVLAGVGFSYARIRTYDGKRVDATAADGSDASAIEAPTRVTQDCAAGKLVGCAGGRDDVLRLGISYDTRDFEPDPNRGIFVDAELDVGTVALGSEYDYARFLATARGYWSPIPDDADLVLAGRALFQVSTHGAPFFSLDTLPFTDNPLAGLGGHRTMRGFRQDRFVGNVYTLANAEVRWTFAQACLWKQRFAFIVAPFFDLGRPYDDVGSLTLHDWRRSYGGALRIAWNLATIVTIDYGISAEDTGFYINFNHIF